MVAPQKPRPLQVLTVALALSILLFLITIQTHLMNSIDFSKVNVVVVDQETSQLGAVSNGTLKTRGTKERRLPQAIVIGTRKSGTRALVRFLEINPSIRSAHNEVHFFDRLDNYKRGLEWYREQMPLTDEHQLTIEKSPAYFVTNSVPERIKAMNSSIKLIVIMRDPVTRLISDFSQLLANRLGDRSMNDYEHDEYELSNGDESSPEAATLIENDANLSNAEKDLENHVLRGDGGVDDQRRIVKTGMYAMHLEKWISVFPREQFHFVDGERLIKEPHVELQKLELFLGFGKPTIMKDHFVFSPKKGFYCLANRQSTRHNKRQVKATKSIEKDIRFEPVCLGKSKGRRHVSISKHLFDKLNSFYAPYNEYLYALTGLKFN